MAPRLREADTLKKELLAFEVKLTASAHETSNACEGAHDDLVLAVAMGVWLAERREIPYRTEREDDADWRALAEERAAEERAEKEALEAEARAERERRQQEWLESDEAWTPIG